MEKEDQIFLNHIADLDRACDVRGIAVFGNFLDLRQQSMVQASVQHWMSRLLLCGGYEDAERKIPVFLPPYVQEADLDTHLCVLDISHRGTKPLSHRDYLGAVLGLGVKREKIGDILVSENGCQMIAVKEIAPFLTSNFDKAGSQTIEVAVRPLSALQAVEIKSALMTDTVPSLRLDCLIASAFSLSRAEACRQIAGGKVFVSGMQQMKTDHTVKEGDKLVLRGKGKAVLIKVGGKSRKDRIFVTFERFL